MISHLVFEPHLSGIQVNPWIIFASIVPKMTAAVTLSRKDFNFYYHSCPSIKKHSVLFSKLVIILYILSIG